MSARGNFVPAVCVSSGRASAAATFAGHVRELDASRSSFAALGQAFGIELNGSGIEDARTAEIHFVVRTHGPVIPGRVREMTTTIFGGCSDAPAGVPALGSPGPNDCADFQVAIHQS